MNKELVTIDEITQKASIDFKKKKLREDYSKDEEKYSASVIDKETLEKKFNEYNLELTKLELEYSKIARKIQNKDLYYKRLEILHNILYNNDPNKLDDLYDDLIESIKDEFIKDMEIRLKICKLEFLIDDKTKELQDVEKCLYQDKIYELKLEIRETKKVLKINKLDKIKQLPFEKLVEPSNELLSFLYKEDIYGKK